MFCTIRARCAARAQWQERPVANIAIVPSSVSQRTSPNPSTRAAAYAASAVGTNSTPAIEYHSGHGKSADACSCQ